MDSLQLKPITILGAGSWGTALALYLSRRGQLVRLWSYEVSEISALLVERANNQYLPGFDFPDLIRPTANLAEASKEVQDIIVAVPSVGFHEVLIMLKPLITPSVRIICATKGLDTDTGQLLHEIVEEVLGKTRQFAVLSGPSFAREVASGLPTAVVIASKNQEFRNDLVKRFNSPIFATYTSDDVIGVEIGSVVKNVIAIATGISDGKNFGANARTALITSGLAEMIHLGLALGGKMETFVGLSGIGDLILTATDNQSRNRRLGLSLGKGQDLASAENEIGQVVEGKRNAELVTMLAEKHDIDMPICQAVWKVLQEKLSIDEAIKSFFTHSEKAQLSA